MLEVDRLVEPPALTTDLIEAARRKLLERGWDLAVVVTDPPLKHNGRPVALHVSPSHGVAVVSLPALGGLHLRRRLHHALLELVGELVGGEEANIEPRGWRRRFNRHGLRGPASDGEHVLTLARYIGHLRLWVGMVRANRPWRLALRLADMLVAAESASF